MTTLHQKGAIYHWILLALLPALAVFMYMSLDIPTIGPKGTWAISVQRAGIFAETDMLSIESRAQRVVLDVAADVADDALLQDYGCGRFEGKTVLNSVSGFCAVAVSDVFSTRASSEVSRVVDLPFTVTVVDSKVMGKAVSSKSIGSFDAVPLRESQAVDAGLVYVIRPFPLYYEYTPSFVFDVPLFSTVDSLVSDGKSIVSSCGDVADLATCSVLGYSVCSSKIDTGRRLALICKDGKRLFAVDLTPTVPLPLSSFTVSKEISASGGFAAEVHVPLDGLSDGYVIYYTNSASVGERVSSVQDAEQLFGSLSSTFGDFYSRVELGSSSLAACPLTKENNKGYKCGSQLWYKIVDERFVSGEEYYVAVASVKNGVESPILFVVPIINSVSVDNS